MSRSYGAGTRSSGWRRKLRLKGLMFSALSASLIVVFFGGGFIVGTTAALASNFILGQGP